MGGSSDPFPQGYLMTALRITSALLLCSCHFSTLPAQGKISLHYEIAESLDIAEVVSDFRVNFCLLTQGGSQYVAYYDKQRRMTVASRKLDSKEWIHQILPTEVGWDSHNYITMAMDSEGCLHVSGNMHVVPLVYFRMEKPGDLSSLKAFPMTGKQEEKTTYPKFITNSKGQLLFSYRDGGSGRGNHIYNKYDPATRSWSRFLDAPLFDGETLRSAYPSGPTLGEDGWFHMVWVWRDTPDCATNNHLSYARSKDLIRWKSAFGEEIPIPIVLGEKQAWVDPIPSGGGIINGCAKLFFTSDGRPLIAYHKSDSNANMQVYVARPEDGKWGVHQLTKWDKPVKFGGGGSMGDIGISIGALEEVEPGVLTMTYSHRDYGSGRLVLDEKSLRTLERKIEVVRELPNALERTESRFAGMGIRRTIDTGDSGKSAVSYILQWESLDANRDRRPPSPLPEPVMLRLHKLTLVE
jgi:hypothetical protein